MPTLEELRQRVKVAVETLEDGLTKVYHWRAGGTATLCGRDYAYEGLALRSLDDADNGYRTLCARCAEITINIEKGWS